MNKETPPITPTQSVNWHITKKCNFDCTYCFAGFKDVKGMLPKEVALEIPSTHRLRKKVRRYYHD